MTVTKIDETKSFIDFDVDIKNFTDVFSFSKEESLLESGELTVRALYPKSMSLSQSFWVWVALPDPSRPSITISLHLLCGINNLIFPESTHFPL